MTCHSQGIQVTGPSTLQGIHERSYKNNMKDSTHFLKLNNRIRTLAFLNVIPCFINITPPAAGGNHWVA